MHTTHTPPKNTRRRFNRHNLPPNHGVALAVLNADMEIKCIVASAFRITSAPTEVEKFDQIFFAQTTDAAAVLESLPVSADAHRTTVVFEETACVQRIGRLTEGCWAQIVIENRSGTQLRPRITWQPLDESSWLPTLEMASKFPLPVLGECWPMDRRCVTFAENNPVAWQVAVHAAVIAGGMSSNAFPAIDAPIATDLGWLMEREVKLRTQKSVLRTQRMIEKLPDHLRDAFLAKLSANPTVAEYR